MQKFTFECSTCGKNYHESEVRYLCPECNEINTSYLPPKGVLKTIYGYRKNQFPGSYSLSESVMQFKELKKFQYIDILPINNASSLPKLKVGETPLYLIEQIVGVKLSVNLYFKDDSQNPTYSFKDRASALVSAYAKEKGFDTIVAASTGNAGSSLAGICASQSQNAIILVPESAPLAKLTQIIMYGAKLIPVKGTYDDAFDLSVQASAQFGWYNRNTAFNPLTIEGKKTVSFELFEQLGYKLPNRIFVPTGDGVILSGVYKGFEDLLKYGIIDKIPIVVAVQSSGSDNLVRNISNPEFQSIKSDTLADSISVDIPRNFYMAQQYLQIYNGEMLTVTDEEILSASAQLSKNTGLFAEPASAAAFAGFLSYNRHHKLEENSVNVVLLTGSGLKDLKSVTQMINMPKSIEPTLENLGKRIKDNH